MKTNQAANVSRAALSGYLTILAVCLDLVGQVRAGQTASGAPTGETPAPPAPSRAPLKSVREGPSPDTESAIHGFPAFLDSFGKKQADGDFVQSPEGNALHVKVMFDFGAGHHIQENALFRQKPRLTQESWSWSETKNKEILRRFEVDFRSGKASAEKGEGKDAKRWSENLKIEPGRTFAGVGFVLAIKSLRVRLMKGERIEMQAIGLTPKPRLVTVELSYGSLDQMTMAGRTVNGDRFLIHPKVPAIAKLFVDVTDTIIWLTTPPTVGFLRWEGRLVEVNDPAIRVDLYSGDHSGPARPLHANDHH